MSWLRLTILTFWKTMSQPSRNSWQSEKKSRRGIFPKVCFLTIYWLRHSILTVWKTTSWLLRNSWHFEKRHLDCWEILDILKTDISTVEKFLTVWKTTSLCVKRSWLVLIVETPRLSKKSLIILKTFSWFIFLFWSLTTINKSMKSCLLHGKVDYVHMLYNLKIGQLFLVCIHQS